MYKTTLLAVGIHFAIVLIAQRAEILTPAQIRSNTMTVEQLLGVPTVYVVESCRIYIRSKTGIMQVAYSRDSINCCANANSNNFPALWRDQVIPMGGRRGDTITIDDISMRKGTRLKALPPRSEYQ